MNYYIFYSWQSDVPCKINRNFIEDALKQATLNLKHDFEVSEAIREELSLDQGTEGVPGTPPIAETIFAKIQNCVIYVADVTFIGESNVGRSSAKRLIANPNVLIEYGYAINVIGYDSTIPIMNTVFGAPISNHTSNMPFDMRHLRNPITYNLKENASPEKYARTKANLVRDLTEAMKLVIECGVIDDLTKERTALVCPFCGTKAQVGYKICLGCKAEIVYGLTKDERVNTGFAGFMGGCILCYLVFTALPEWLASRFGWPLVAGWGLGDLAYPFGLGLITLLVLFAVQISDDAQRKRRPRFFRHTVT